MSKKHFIIPLFLILSLSGCTKYNGLPPEEAEHEHTYSSEYFYDSENHWHVATCEHTEQRRGVEAHSFGEFIVVQEATITSDGLKTRTCSVCGYKNEVIVNKLSNTGENTNDPSWTISGIDVDKENIELKVGENPVSISATLVGEGDFPKSLTVYCADMEVKNTVDGEETTTSIKVAKVNVSTIDSGNSFSISALAAGNTKVTITSTANTNIKKEINVVVSPKEEKHSLTIGDESITMFKGSQKVLTCSSTDKVTWTSSNEEIVTLENKTNSGVWIRGLKASDSPVTITATICAGTPYEITKTCEVSVVNNAQTTFNYYFINNKKLTNLHLYLWNEEEYNVTWPGANLNTVNYVNKDLDDVYKITIDTEEKAYSYVIVSGTDSNGSFVQTDKIAISSFGVQNAFKILEIPSDAVDGSKKASIKLCSFDTSTDVMDEHYIMLSMNSASLISGNSVDVICYTSEASVEYVISGTPNCIELSNTSEKGFTINAIGGGTAYVEADITVGDETYYDRVYVTVKEDQVLTYYFTNNYSWTDLNVYMWNDTTGRHNASYPGTPLNTVVSKDDNGNDIYEITFKKLSDNWENIVVSGVDGTKGSAKTVDIAISDFGSTNNNIQLDGWSSTGVNCAKVKFSKLTTKYYIKTESSVTINAGAFYNLSVLTNGKGLSYEIMNGSSYIELSNESDSGVKITGKAKGSAAIKITVGEGDAMVSKVVSITVYQEEIITYYFLNEYEWTNVTAYMFNDKGSNKSWPGEPLTLVAHDSRGKEIYKVSYKKYDDNWSTIIIAGHDVGNNHDAQTVDISLSQLNENNNRITISGWEDFWNYKASYTLDHQENFLTVESESKTVNKYDEWDLKVYANSLISIMVSDHNMIQISENADGYHFKAFVAGTVQIAFSVGTGASKITKTYNVTIMDNGE